MSYVKSPILSICVLSVLLLTPAMPAAAATVPAGFTDVSLFTLGSPTALAFLPDGRLLVTTQGGTLRVYKNGALVVTPALTFGSICSNFERGLLGVAVDPDFASNRYIYLFYTFNSSGTCVNRVSRFTFGTGDTVTPGTELVLVDNMPSPNANHNAGDVHFGRDGYLYISIGDGGCDWAGNSGCAGSNDASRDQHVLTGKILRITNTGGIPASNPFQGAGTARCNVTGQTTPGNKCQETFSWGLRNPFRFAFDPNDAGSRFFINDVGQGAWEEIDLGQSGADFGWNCREGAHVNGSAGGQCMPAPAGMVDPFFEYSRSASVPGTADTGCASITGGAFAPDGVWPGYDGAYLFGDYVCGKIFTLTQSGGGTWSAVRFANSAGGVTSMTFGPHGNGQAFYYLTFTGGGQVHRVTYDSAGNEAPTAVIVADPLSGSAPLLVNFDGSASSDPDAGDVLTWFWDFGDGGPVVETAGATVSHTYTTAGTFTATLRVRDDSFTFSAPSSAVIQPGNTPPVPTIVTPADGTTFRVGETITLNGSAMDAEDGTLPASALSWMVYLNHNGSHIHPLLGPVSGNGVTFTAPAPEDLAATDGSFVEIHLTATDSGGLAATEQRDFEPHKVSITFATNPAGLDVVVNGFTLTGPETVTSWESWGLNVFAPSQDDGGTYRIFESWSDGGNQNHTIVTPASPVTYTAVFQTSVTTGPLDFNTVSLCRLVDTRTTGPALAAGSTRTFSASGVCGVPGTAKALAVTTTVIGGASGGHLRFWPAGTPMTTTSTMNFSAGGTRANNAIVGLGASADFSVLAGFTGGTADLIVDVVGWFE